MANKKLFAGILVMALVFGMVLVACSGDGGADAELVGTKWVYGNEQFEFTERSFTGTDSGKNVLKGTYKTSGANVTLTTTDVWYKSTWLQKAQLLDLGVGNDDLVKLFSPITGKVNGNKLTLTWNGETETYTKK